ncbi:preprotein translocase subunit SecG [Enterobacteriaceae endosymbiont of Plateumaris rustica]|uniref:preprotein translocase subunit SecG n=1 Tax=Enterobacteriaceae endosymbiont of Plateumaris rustica TaxID=2675796 RepID=UPI001449EA5F|nr:preprotein translocase subunit SecG [Enterobacteriaceae endosymbiont of Plateumaris rustica]QJC29163.1 preprotein translocase subunit SecG [Enterobacteriaceae endosymbiont of Plateumaris rustica]
MYTLFLILFVLVSVILISLIILQNNNIVDISNYSIYSSKSFFKSNTPNKIVTRSIFILAIVFFMISLILSNLNNHKKNIITKNYINL